LKHKQLKAFHAVALERSFSRAAERLCLTQPALTVQVRNLERDYGVRLFDRQGHGVALTAQGESLFSLTRQLFAIECEIRDSLHSHSDQLSGELRIGTDNPFTTLPLVSALQQKHPGIRIELVAGNGRQVLSQLLEEQVDIAVVTNAPDDPRLQRTALQQTRLQALVPATSELAATGTISIAQLLTQPLVCREASANTHQLLQQAITDSGQDGSRAIASSLRVGSRELMKEAVATGMGVGFIMSGEAGQDPRLHCLEIEGVDAIRTDYLLNRLSDRYRKVVTAVLAAIPSCMPDEEGKKQR